MFYKGDVNIDLKNVFRGNTLLLTIVMIVPTSLYSGDATIIMPTILFIGILSGILKNSNMNETLVSTLISFLIGSVITFLISLIVVYYTEGGFYAIALIQYSLINIIIFTLIGCIGGALGYHVKEEIKKPDGVKQWI